MKKILIVVSGLLVAVMSLISCNEAVSERLADIDSFVCDAPDSALAVLDSIPLSSLRTREQRARYALLKSVALDKNCIDVKSDSIIAPAVEYYRRHGSPDDRLKTYYYRGLVSFYSDDFDTAMEYFSKASQYALKAQDKSVAGLIYEKMSIIYSALFDSESSLKKAQMAATAYLEAGDYSYYIDELLSMLNTEIILERYDSAAMLAENIWKNKDRIDSVQLSSLYSNSLKIATYTKKPHIDSIISEYCVAFIHNESIVDWLAVANAYCNLGNYDKAYQVISDKHEYITLTEDYEAYPFQESAYYSLYSQIYEHLGDYRQALKVYSEYVRITDEQDLKIFESKAKFAEESFRNEMERQGLRFRNLVLSLVSIAVLAILVIVSAVVVRKLKTKKKENDRLVQMCAKAQEEIEELHSWKSCTLLDEDTLQLFEQRLKLLNECIVEHMSGCEANVKAKLETVLKDRNAFWKSAQAYFMLSHPEFLTMLVDKGLDKRQIGICCLIASGAKGKNIAARLCISDGTYRNAVSTIRKKLGVGKDSRDFGTYLSSLIGKVR